MSKYYYERSGIIDSKINITYHELFLKNDEELDEWIEEARQFIIEDWDERGTPPMVRAGRMRKGLSSMAALHAASPDASTEVTSLAATQLLFSGI